MHSGDRSSFPSTQRCLNRDRRRTFRFVYWMLLGVLLVGILLARYASQAGLGDLLR